MAWIDSVWLISLFENVDEENTGGKRKVNENLARKKPVGKIPSTDYTAVFSRKEKVSSLQNLEQDENGRVIKAFAKLASANCDIDMDPFRNFVCKPYSLKKKNKERQRNTH